MSRLFSKRIILTALAGIGFVTVCSLAALALYLNSPGFKEKVRQTIVSQIEQLTGGTASLPTVRWNVWDQRFVLENLTVRGLEPAEGQPLVHVESITAGFKLRNLLQRRLYLSELTVTNPKFLLLVDSSGNTNIPSPQSTTGQPFDFQVSIDNFTVVGGQALINERRVGVEFVISNLMSDLSYESADRTLSVKTGFDGTLKQRNGEPLGYRVAAKVDYTMGSLVGHAIQVESEKSKIDAHGKIENVLTNQIQGKLEYAGSVDSGVLNYFLPKENVTGTSTVAGLLEFSHGYFFTKGNSTSRSITYEGWNVTDIRADYNYHYPGRKVALRNLTARTLEGTVSGSLTIDPLPGSPRFNVDLEYKDINAASLTHIYPWNRKYVIYSRASGVVHGWVQDKFNQFELDGTASLISYSPEARADIVPLPLDGSAGYRITPNSIELREGQGLLRSTSVRASGVIRGPESNLVVDASSSDLTDLAFLHPKANGAGTFSGTLTGPVRTPVLKGAVALDGYKHGTWTLRRAAGEATVDTLKGVASFSNVKVEYGQSQATIRTGTASLDGTAVDLHMQIDRGRGEDLAAIVGRNVNGEFTGNLHLTSVTPLRFEADRINATGVVIEGRALGSIQASVKYDDPTVVLENLKASDRGATLTGGVTYDRKTEALTFDVHLSSLDFGRLRDLGVPETIKGVLKQADLKGKGSLARPEVSGSGTVQNLSFHGETFPEVSFDITSNWPRMIVTLNNDRDISLTANVNVEAQGYPFEAVARFRNYSLEDLTSFGQSSLVATGSARLSGTLKESAGIKGQGTIESAQIRFQEHILQVPRPFSFAFDTSQLTLSKLTLSEKQGPQMEIEGTIGLSRPATLDLTAVGSIDLSLLAASDPKWDIAGILTINGNISGTTQHPELSGSARLSNASLEREGVFATFLGVSGDAVFNGNQMTVTNLEGRIGGGTLRMQGGGVLQNNQIENMNFRIEADDVRFRYPDGLRTVLDGALVLTGNWAAPVLAGNLQIQNLAYRSEFEEFLALFRPGGLDNTSSELSSVQLSLRVSGNRNITIKNELADVEARVDLDIKGTVGNPTMTGHIEASGGTLLFQGNRYEITRGNIDFVDPLRIDPAIDIQAETELRDYRVILRIVGRGERTRIDLSSDPPLPQLELVGLIAGGKTSDELATEFGRGDLPTSEELFSGGAASIVLNQQVGGRFGFLGIDRFRFDPYLVGAGSNPSARVTLTKQVTKDLSVTYSQDVVSSQQRVILIEYFLNKNLSIVASREETSENAALGLDIRLRKRF